jgi:hypothetical protein
MDETGNADSSTSEQSLKRDRDAVTQEVTRRNVRTRTKLRIPIYINSIVITNTHVCAAGRNKKLETWNKVSLKNHAPAVRVGAW